MKRLFILWVLLSFAFAAPAQNERDFAAQYMKIYGKDDTSLQLNTVSPSMMERVMNLDTVDKDENMRMLMRQIKTVRILTATGEEAAEDHYESAMQLAETNARRYQCYRSHENAAIYLRKKKAVIVELVFISRNPQNFRVIDLTGKMSEDFIQELSKI